MIATCHGEHNILVWDTKTFSNRGALGSIRADIDSIGLEDECWNVCGCGGRIGCLNKVGRLRGECSCSILVPMS